MLQIHQGRWTNLIESFIHPFLQRCDTCYPNLGWEIRRLFSAEKRSAWKVLASGVYHVHTIYWHDSSPTFYLTNITDIFECSSITAPSPRVVESPFFVIVLTMDDFIISNVTHSKLRTTNLCIRCTCSHATFESECCLVLATGLCQLLSNSSTSLELSEATFTYLPFKHYNRSIQVGEICNNQDVTRSSCLSTLIIHL